MIEESLRTDGDGDAIYIAVELALVSERRSICVQLKFTLQELSFPDEKYVVFHTTCPQITFSIFIHFRNAGEFSETFVVSLRNRF